MCAWPKRKPSSYKPVDINEPIDVPIYSPVKRDVASSVVDVEKKKREYLLRLERQKKKRSGVYEQRKNVLSIPSYMSYLHAVKQVNNMEIHHWIPRSKIRRNDYFVCCIPHEKHWSIHHGDLGVNGFIEEYGEGNLLFDSAMMFAEWLASEHSAKEKHRDSYISMLKEIRGDVENLEHVLSVTRKYAEEIRLDKFN